ncbi:MAG: amidohydrolase [Bacteroidota bacterium]|nr:amidohydrolase [Bacteroidota bacterium]
MINEELNITLIQTELFWEDAQKNRDDIGKKISSIPNNTDIIILPEMFTTGFSMNVSKLAEKFKGETFDWLQKSAKEKDSLIIGSLIVEENKNFYNRLIAMFPNGNYEYYDKRHLFRMGNEHTNYSGGNDRLILNYKGWRIYPLICYDLRFPVWSRNTDNYDILIYIANWPKSRSFVWKHLLIARALENQSYVAGVNRIGTDGQNLNYSGDSMLINAKGEIINALEANKNTESTFTIKYSELKKFREKFPVALDADNFKIL